MFRGATRLLIVGALVALAGLQARVSIAQAPISIKLATIAPQGTSPHRALLNMREKWQKASGGKVEVKVYAGGSQGGEADTVKRIRIKQLQASLLTVTGLSDIDSSASA